MYINLQLLDVMPAHIVQESQTRLVPSERWTKATPAETVPLAPPISSDPHSQVNIHGPQSDDDLQSDVLGELYLIVVFLQSEVCTDQQQAGSQIWSRGTISQSFAHRPPKRPQCQPKYL